MNNITEVPTSDLAKSIAAQAKTGNTIKDIALGRSDIFRVNPYSLHIKSGWNCREMESAENLQHIDDTARSIAAYGVKEPLTVYSDGGALWVSDGHVRLTATFRAIEVYGAEVVSIPVKTEPKGTSDEDRLFSQVIRNSGKPFSGIEKAKLVKRFQDLGYSVEDIAKKWTCSMAQINNLLNLNAAPVFVKNLINSGTVSVTHAQTVIRDNGEAGAVRILGEAVTAAQAAGRDRVTAKDTGNVPIKKAVKDAMESSEIDDDDDFTVLIKMPIANWKVLRDLLKL